MSDAEPTFITFVRPLKVPIKDESSICVLDKAWKWIRSDRIRISTDTGASDRGAIRREQKGRRVHLICTTTCPSPPFFLPFLPFLPALNLTGSSGYTWYATALTLFTSSLFFHTHPSPCPQMKDLLSIHWIHTWGVVFYSSQLPTQERCFMMPNYFSGRIYLCL